jgi:tyrosine-specific transport protein
MAFWQGVFLLVGTTIGAGVFSLPYSFSRSGWGVSVLGLIVLGVMMTALNLFYSKIILDNRGDHQLVGYVEKYLGSFWQKVALFALLFSVNGVMIAYVILGGEFLSLLFGQSASVLFSSWFYLIIAFLFMRGFKFLAKVESVFSITLILLFLFFPLLVIKYATPSQMAFVGQQPLFFWGPTLLALSGFSAIPEVEEILRKSGQRKKLNRTVIVGTWLPILVYCLFAFGVYSVTGVFTTADALTRLVQVIPHIVQVAAGIGLLALLTSFLSLANVAKETYYRDLKVD